MGDEPVYNSIMEKFTFTGNKENGIKDGIRNEWYSKFDLASPAEERNMPYTGVIERPDLQQIFLNNIPDGVVRNDNGQVGYKVYIGPKQYFVITDIGNGRYQWYAFLAKPPGSAEKEEKPDGTVPYLSNVFTGWSGDIHDILSATKEDEVQQRDLYDRPPSVIKPWTKGSVALLGDSVHAMMPNLGQGGCQAIEDAFVLEQELMKLTNKDGIESKLGDYKSRRFIRSAAIQGLSRFASDIIIRGFDTPAKIVNKDGI